MTETVCFVNAGALLLLYFYAEKRILNKYKTFLENIP